MTPIFPLCLALALTWSAGALAGPAQEFQEIKSCPEEFPVDAVTLSPLPKGWVGIRPPKLLLMSADIILGPPDRPGVQIGKRRKTKNGYTVTFDHLYTTAPQPVQKWLACRYGDLSLAERLPDKTESCTFTYTRDAYNGHDIQFACRIKP